MTTNVRDSVSHVMAADSRWSVQLAGFGLNKILYVDEANYQKIITFGNSVFMFAGLCTAIDVWKYAIALASYSASSVDWGRLPTQEFCVSIVKVGTGELLFEVNHPISYAACSFAGSGAKYAYDCWVRNKEATKAVESAIAKDVYSGGQVRYHAHLTGDNNFGFDKSLRELNYEFSERGLVMEIDQNSAPMPIKDAIVLHPILETVLEQLAQGKLSASAPFPGMDAPWRPEDRSRLVATMESIFPKS